MSKNVLMIIAQNNFRDEEYEEPRKIFESRGYNVTVASTITNPVKGMLGRVVTPDITIEEVKIEDYDAVVFIGGSGATQYFNDSRAHQIARKALESQRILGAICLAPTILANAGLLAGKKATVWASERGTLQRQGATYSGRSLEVDEGIVTADGPQSAREFGNALVKAIEGK